MEMKSADQPEIKNMPEFPVVTVISSLAVFFFFGFLVWLVTTIAAQTDVVVPTLTGEQKLADLKAEQDKFVTSYAFDKATNTIRVPVDVAMKHLVQEANSKGGLPLPMKMTPVAKAPEAAPAPKAAEPAKKAEPAAKVEPAKKDEPAKEKK